MYLHDFLGIVSMKNVTYCPIKESIYDARCGNSKISFHNHGFLDTEKILNKWYNRWNTGQEPILFI